VIAAAALGGILLHLLLRFALRADPSLAQGPLLAVLVAGGAPLVWDILRQLLRREWGSDLLAALSILTALLLREHLAGVIIVLMLASGKILEDAAVRHAAAVLQALAKRMPSVAHVKRDAHVADVPLQELALGDALLILPHEICPVDGVVVEGHGMMDESFLTGEPFRIAKAPGSPVLSGAVNGEGALTITATKRAVDSRYAKIVGVMREAEEHAPRLRRLGDRLGAWYVPLALGIGATAWAIGGSPSRFLAVLVIATPCPMLIGIPVAILGAVSLAAKRSIIIKKPVVLERVRACRTAIFDKTGTLTYGEPVLAEILPASGFTRSEVLAFAASLEQYSRHPLAGAVLKAARAESAILHEAEQVHEPPGAGLQGVAAGRRIQLTSRRRARDILPAAEALMPPTAEGLECVVLIDGAYAATLRFRDEPRPDGRSFIGHLGPRHQLQRVVLVSGDRASEVDYLARQVGITEVFAQQSPEQKLALVRRETARSPTVMVGDGINDAPALLAATVGVAVGQRSDITAEAAGVVIMDSSLRKLDEFLHISNRMRRIALQSAVGGMACSLIGMLLAAGGWLTPVAGAIGQELIDVLAILDALRAAWPPRELSDYGAPPASP
jgi:heavy metal translocating P-type ATPase